MRTSLLEAAFPALRHCKWEITSPGTVAYNCIAWAAGETHRCWWPIEHPRYYWPEGVPREETIERFRAAFQMLGYHACDNAESEEGSEKVAVYADSYQVPTHMARQLRSGEWTSKLGDERDILHDTLHALEGDQYGYVALIMKRPFAHDDTAPMTPTYDIQPPL